MKKIIIALLLAVLLSLNVMAEESAAEINENELTWLKTASDNDTYWFGIDNSDGVFEPGSRLCARMIENDSIEWNNTYNELSSDVKERSDGLIFFDISVESPEGEKCADFGETVPFYVICSSSLNTKKLQAVCVENDSETDISYTVMRFPDGFGAFEKVGIRSGGVYAFGEKGDNYSASVFSKDIYVWIFVSAAVIIILVVLIILLVLRSKKTKGKH